MEKNEIIIDEMTMNDFNNIKDSLSEEFDDFWNENILKSELENINSKYFVAKKNNMTVGFAGILVLIDSVEITNIVVKKCERNEGIGSILLEKLISEGIILKKDNISLEVNEKNSIAIMLYEKYNFKQVGLRKKYYNGENNAIIMTRKL